MKPLAPNTLLQNRYLIVQLIGKGGMGEVYLAVDQRLGSAMALKRTFFNDDETLKAAFEREAKTLARLRHPVLPKVSDNFTENDLQYLVMEHISGDDLAKRLELSKQPFPLNWVLFWADQLLDALAYLHSHEPPIIHRDIKPQNLKLTNDNHIILLDFGLAKNSIGETRNSTSGALSGYTPHYASMEQIRGTGTTAQSDIYSLSATVYQLLTDTVPPDALTRADAVLGGSPDPVKPVNELNAEVSQAISAVILKGMNLSAEQRYHNAREMQTALREAYAQMQQVMSAQTVAFNTSDSAASEMIPTLPQSQMKTEQYSVPPSIPPQNDISGQKPTDYNSFPPQTTDKNVQVSTQEAKDFNATVKYDAPLIGEKTEVLPNGISNPTWNEPVKTHNEPVNFQSEPSNFHNEPVNFQNDSAHSQNEEFNPDATMPIIAFNDDIIGAQPEYNKTEAINLISTPQVVSQPEMRTEQVSKEEITTAPEEVKTPPVKPTPKKKGSGKFLAIIGGILGLGIVGLAAAAIALYVLKPTIITDLMGTTATPTPTPVIATPTPETSVTPTVEPSFTPTSEPTVEPTVTTTATPLVTSPTTEPTTTVEKTPRPQVDKTVEPTPVKTVQPNKTPVPKQTVPKATPPPKPTRDPGKVLQ